MRSCRLFAALVLVSCTASAQPMRIETDDGLGLHMTPGGKVIYLSVDGRIAAAPDVPGGFIIADMGAEIPASANLIRNPSVETDADNDGKPDGWTLDADWSWDKTTAHSGARSLKVAVPPGPTVRSSGPMVMERFAVQPGRRYTYSFWAKTQDSGGRHPSCTYIRQYDADGKTCAPQHGLGTKPGTNDWFFVRGEFRPTPQTRFIDVYANIYQSHGACWYDDFSLVPADAAEQGVELSMEQSGDRIEGRGTAQEIALNAAFLRQPGRIRADVEVRDLARRDRRIVVGFDIPIVADGWTWWDNICAKRTIDKPETYEWCVGVDLGEGKLSIYPFNSLADASRGITLGAPLDQGPRIWKAAYDNVTKRLKVRFYLGLTQETTKFPGKATFSFLLYRHDPRWGMRAAAQRFYEFYPEQFLKRSPYEAYLNYANMEYVNDDGNLNARGDVLADAADFGESIPLFTHMHGGYACDFWPTDRTDAPNDDEVREFLARHAKEIGEPENNYTPPSQILKQITHDPEGRIRFHRKDCLKAGARYARPDSGGWFFEFRVMEDPEVSDWVAGLIDRRFKAWREKNPDLKPFHYCMSSDEIQGYTGTGNGPDFRREHFPFTDVPLSFHKTSLELARVNLMYDFLKTFLWPHSQKNQYLTTGNANYFNRSFCFPYVDMGMVEWEWDRTNPLRTGAYARTMSHHKLYRFWRVCGNGEADRASVLTHLHRCLYWAMYPAVAGMQDVTHNLDDYRYLYRRYVPIMERLSASGWEPVTHAAAAPDGVLIERYGKFEDGSLHFSVRNISGGQTIDLEKPNPKDVTVTVDGKALGIAPDDNTLVCDELTHVTYTPIRRDGENLLIDLKIPNGETRVLHLTNGAGRSAFAQVEERRARERLLRFYGASSLDGISSSPRAKNAIQLAKLTYRHLESRYPATSDRKGVRLHVPDWPTAFKNRDAALTLGIENASEKPIANPKIALATPFADNVVKAEIKDMPAEIAPGERKDVVVHLRISDEVPRDVVSLCATVLDEVTRVIDVRVLTLAPECELLPERLSTVTEPQQLLLAMQNPFKETIKGEVELIAPKHITTENAKHQVEIEPGQRRRVTCLVTVPEKQRDIDEKFRFVFTPTGEKPVETIHALRAIGNRKRCKLPPLDTMPKVDGNLDDDVWRNAALLDDFRNPKNPVPATAATRVKAGRFGDSIWFGIDCAEPQMEGLSATVTEANGPVSRDDCVEIRFAPGHKKDILTFWVNALGTRSSVVTNDWEAAGTKRENGYTIEIRIPLSALSAVLPDPGEVWGFNVLRHRRAGEGETTQWSQSNWTWGDPVFYGDLIFAGK